MKIARVISPLLIVFLFTVPSTRQSSFATATDQGASARGEGGFSLFDGLHTVQFHFVFDVQANKHGNARGRAEFDNLTDNTQVVAKIDCLNVIGPEALMTGTVLHSNDPDFPKRATVVFDALDAQLDPIFHFDTITPLFISQFTDCHDAASPLTILQVDDSIHIDPGSDD